MIEKLLETDSLVVAAIKTPETPLRDHARMLVRSTLRRLLAEKLGTDEANIPLVSHPGHPIRLPPPWSHIGLSVSHEPGRSLIAINLGGPIGIDLLRHRPCLQDIPLLSRDYLGPATAADLARLPAERQPTAFARAWCRLEAALKCLGLPLSEWTPEQESQRAACTVTDLALAPGWTAALATASRRD